jgi:hypothetical protein
MAKVSPNTKVKVSGIYRVYHAEDHVPPHHVTALFGDTFPS